MCCLGIFKRVVPFLLAFTTGLFIASFFVTITAPSFGNSRRQVRMRECKRVQMNYEELQRENQRLREELDEARAKSVLNYESDIRLAVPPPPLAPTVNGKTKTVIVKVH